ncbi:hypothetical protein Sste5346_001420 [Sporothrix stenoceras]|uniref:Uncharacterized protein n=1 Tax=Sporothrix stenoceras TaxID=5173 RepID=A0ABR3ZPN4_9PEZI
MSDSPFTGPGVFWISSNTSDEAVFPYTDFVRWYEDVHIPDVVNADPENPLPVERRYELVSGDTDAAAKPFLVIYKLPTLSFVTSEAFRHIPLHHKQIPEDGPIAKFASFRGRFARHVETWVGGGATGTLLLSEIVESSNVNDYSECMSTVAGLPGWQRSTHFEVVMENEIDKDKAPPAGGPAPPATTSTDKPPRWLTLHEFDEKRLEGVGEVIAKLESSLLERKGRADEDIFELVPYRLVRVYGDKAAAFADGKDTKV